MITLYDYELSGNCYKLRLLMSILGVDYKIVPVDFYPGREHKSEWFLKLNPLGQFRCIEDDGLVLRDAQAILVYLAAKYDPLETAGIRATIRRCSARSASGWPSPTASRRPLRRRGCMTGCSTISTSTLPAPARTGCSAFSTSICGSANSKAATGSVRARHPTIADIACFPYIMLSEEGGISRQDYPAIRRWCDRVKRIKGFIVMSGVFPAGPARAA